MGRISNQSAVVARGAFSARQASMRQAGALLPGEVRRVDVEAVDLPACGQSAITA